PHALALDAGVALGGGLRAGASWRGAWGRTWGLRRVYYDYLADAAGAFAPFDLDRPEDHALPATYTLDLDLTLVRAVAGTVVEVRGLVANVLDRRNVYDWSLEPAGDGVAALPRTLPGRHLAFSLRVGLWRARDGRPGTADGRSPEPRHRARDDGAAGHDADDVDAGRQPRLERQRVPPRRQPPPGQD